MFKKAKRIWLRGLAGEMNIQARFVAELIIPDDAKLYVTGATFYKVSLNGELIHYGPAPTAAGFARVDVVPLPVTSDKVRLSIEVAGYRCNSYAAVNQESYIIAEIRSGDEAIAYTGRDFAAYRVASREQKALRYSGQRHFSEVWCTDAPDVLCEAEILPNEIKYLQRKAPLLSYDAEIPQSAFYRGRFTLPDDFDERNLDKVTDSLSKPINGRTVFPADEVKKFPTSIIAAANYNIREEKCEIPVALSAGELAVFECERNSSGIIHFECTASQGARIIIAFDEICMDGRFPNLMSIANAIDVSGSGDISLENFEIYSFKYYAVFVVSGEIRLKDIHKIRIRHVPERVPALNTDDAELVEIYEAALESYRANSLGIFTDCPSRERAGWLCDSMYIARGSYAITGNTLVEDDFLENFRNHGCKTIPEGMIPMCYPAEHPIGRFIPQYSLWFIIQLAEYKERNKEADLSLYRDTVYGILGFFAEHENELSLLEDLPSWNFVEWSEANKWCAGVNFPTNMLYAGVLDAVADMYGDEALRPKAEKIRERVRKLSFDGEFFHDQALRGDGGELAANGHISEVCQYYAFYFGVADAENCGELKDTLLSKFGPNSENYPEIEKANAFMGALLRMELLLAWGERDTVIREIKGYFLHMAQLTGTLWEHKSVAQSLNHGFPSFIAAILLQMFGEK